MVDVAGAPYDKITSVTNVQHLAQIDDASALVLTAARGAGPVNLQTIALP